MQRVEADIAMRKRAIVWAEDVCALLDRIAYLEIKQERVIEALEKTIDPNARGEWEAGYDAGIREALDVVRAP
jgi:hypothetical protein